MRLSFALVVIYTVCGLLVLATQISHEARGSHGEIADIAPRATDSDATTAEPTKTETASDETETASNEKTSESETATATDYTKTSATSTTTSPTETPSSPVKNETSPVAPGSLPLEPEITPALGISGFILLTTGAILALIGIRNLWVQVFLSTAFLTSLGVTVLIVYVMSPPVRVAVQGAYLVAVFFTGVTFGALSIVFKELTEGLGCLLGGFCVSMWLLSLSPGGLLKDSGSKSGFIGAISVGCYAMSFSQYTRPWGLIVSTSIAGGTAVALGIDCYSRAGLKEFWLYIWGLNEDIFPLGTNTYPVTRNIRVELAATVIVAILGVISQLRLWKIIREKRRKDEEVRLEEQKRDEESEAETARHLEEKNIRERNEWETKYGDPNSVTELPDDEEKCHNPSQLAKEEMQSITSSSYSEKSPRCSDCRERADNGESAYASSESSSSSSGSSRPDTSRGSVDENDTPHVKVFDGAAASKIKDDRASDVTAILGSETATIRSKRFSGKSFKNLRRMSVMSRSSMGQISQSQEALLPRDDGSSVQGIADEASDADSGALTMAAGDPRETKDAPESKNEDEGEAREESSKFAQEAVESRKFSKETKGSPEEFEGLKEGPKESSEENLKVSKKEHKKANKQSRAKPSLKSTPIARSEDKSHSEDSPAEKNKAAEEKSISSEDSSTHASPDAEIPPPLKPRKSSSSKVKSNEKNRSSSSIPKTTSKPKKEKPQGPPKLDTQTVNHLPQRSSRVVQCYRTNEWAKHLADAEAPELEPIEPVHEDDPDTPDDAGEAPAPVHVEELLQTPLNAQPPPAVEFRSPLAREPPNANEDSRRSSDSRRHSSTKKQRGSGVPFVPTTHLSQVSVPQPPLVQTIADEPILGAASPPADPSKEENQSAKPQWKGPPPLIAVREGMMRNRLSSFSLHADPWSSRSSPGQSPIVESPPHPLPPIRHTSTTYPPIPEEADDLPLSQRRTMLHQRTSVVNPLINPFDLPLESHRDAHPLLSIPERRRSRITPSPNSLVVERSQGETESGRSSIALPRRQRRHSGAFAFDNRWAPEEMSAPHAMSQDTQGLRPPDRAHLGGELPAGPPGPPLEDRPRHIASQASLRSNAPIASIPSHTVPVGEADVAEELAWGPAHPCFPHFNPHVPIGSQEYETTRIIRIRRDWMIKGDLAPTFSNLYPEILDPLIPDQEFRRIINTVNDALVQAFDPFSLRNWVDGVVGLLTGWVWEDLGAPAVKSHLQRVEDWLENWNREVGEKDGVHIWSLRRSAYMSLDIQIPDPKVGIIPTQSIASRPGSAM
ncbi:hypothetical protein P168DRAFT_264757 [Aspergillus campestris IBT 28561]|uniref:Uncharacterized protein n=1 Tax=Aspergillus campestris (strain IBT 28561) TaxID=1392248 RepID=A0A2I1D8N7_ASPC2|nr:uncharacterized protein P168DRAFT_264757 [Aspergillus campestris IBT 28561]PKY06218.1 hypothetical protein P168DRAFT_264757 [Aspergillus campestris IBT 28561]